MGGRASEWRASERASERGASEQEAKNIEKVNRAWMLKDKIIENCFLLKVHKSVRGWIEVQADQYIPIRTLTISGDPLDAAS